MTETYKKNIDLITDDLRFKKGIQHFNSADWYLAHDLFEEMWHETIGPPRRTLQAVLQIAVAQLHLERGNFNGATILYGEALGRLKDVSIDSLGLDLKRLIKIVEIRLKTLQNEKDPQNCELPYLHKTS